MSVIKLESKEAKPDLVVEYKGKQYILPGNLSADDLEVFVNAQGQPIEATKAFLSRVIPKDFKKVLAQADLEPLTNIWLEYVKAPKELPSEG